MKQYGVSFIEELLYSCQQVEVAAMSFHPCALKKPWKEDTTIHLRSDPKDWWGWEGCHDSNNWYVKEEAMKVQRKRDPFKTWEVIEESPNHYIVSDGSPRGEGLAYCLPKADYEPVQEWVDVTHECYASLIDNTYRLYHGKNGGKWIGDQYGYRVTNAGDLSKIKVEVKR